MLGAMCKLQNVSNSSSNVTLEINQNRLNHLENTRGENILETVQLTEKKGKYFK